MEKEKNKERIPQLRFPEFKNAPAWEQRKSDKIFQSVSDKNHPDLPVLSASQELGMVKRDDVGIDIKYDKSSLKNYKRVVPGQFVIHLRSFQGGFAHSIIEGITSPAYTILDFVKLDEHSDLFWKNILTSRDFIKRLEAVTYGIRDGRSISFSDFSSLNFNFPTLPEQKAIGDFFSTLDHSIALHQRELENLKNRKKSLLQKMFPKNGESVPKIRFPEFKNAPAWEQRKLGEVGITQSGIGFPDAEQGGKEGIPFFKVSDMNIIGNEFEMQSANNYVSKEQIERKNWKPITSVPAIMFAKVGAAIMLNRKRLIRHPFLIDNNTMAYIFDKTWDINFGKIIFDTIYLPKYSQVGALPSYNGSDIENINVFMPNSLPEQKAIGDFFSTLDRSIALHQRE